MWIKQFNLGNWISAKIQTVDASTGRLYNTKHLRLLSERLRGDTLSIELCFEKGALPSCYLNRSIAL